MYMSLKRGRIHPIIAIHLLLFIYLWSRLSLMIRIWWGYKFQELNWLLFWKTSFQMFEDKTPGLNSGFMLSGWSADDKLTGLLNDRFLPTLGTLGFLFRKVHVPRLVSSLSTPKHNSQSLLPKFQLLHQ